MPPAVRRLPRSAHLHIPGHRVVITPSQLRRRPITTREVVRLQNFHDLPARFHPPSVAGTESDSQQVGNYLAVRGEKTWQAEEHTSELPSLMRISYSVFC